MATQNLDSVEALGFERLLSIDEAAGVLRRSHWTLRNDIKTGRLRCLRVGRKILIKASELQRILAESRT